MLSDRDYKKLHHLIQIVYVLAFVLIAYFVFRYILGTIAPFIIAFIAASLVEPLVRRMTTGRVRLPRGIASSLCIVGLLLIFFLLGWFLSTAIWSEGKAIVTNIPNYLRDILNYLQNFMENREGVLSFLPEGALERTINYLSNYDYSTLFTGSLGNILLGYAGNVVVQIPNVLIFFIVTTVSSIFMSISFPVVKAFIMRQFNQTHQELIREIQKSLFSTVGKYLRSYLLLMLITFAELLVFFLIFGFKPALTLAFFIAIVDILPVLGVGTVLIPWSLFCLLSGKPWRALILICMYVVITVIRQILEPKVIGDHVGMLPVLTLFCIWVGLKLLGFGGMFLVPITVVIIKNLHENGKIRLWKNKTEDQKEVSG